MAGVYWFEGKWYDEEPKVLGPMDHAFWLGSVIFDGARAIKGLVPDLDRHCQRAVRSARNMGMDPKITAEEIEGLCREAVRKMGAEAELYIRPMFFIRKGLGAAFPDPSSTTFILAVYDAPLPPPTGFSACHVSQRRPAPNMAPTDAKASALYPNSSRAVAEAKEKGFDNAILLDFEGNVAEFATSNVIAVKNGVVFTPKPNNTFLAGITRLRVLELLRNAGYQVEERSVKPEELDDADEIFSVGNFAKVTPCTRFGARNLQPGPVYNAARKAYFDWAEENSRLLPKAG
ncbi:branched-chain amino acid aminotransferase [Acetobacteraceae bacterium H6797]|nr:branched-chain amino acid aminotransferase [Acetobacteraceae bacterium H6797]